MSKNTRISNRIGRIEDRFKTKVSKGRKGTDMDIEIHERRIEKLRGKQRKNTLQHESQHSALHRNSPLGFTMPHSPLNQNDSIAASKAWNKFKSGYMNRTHKFKGRKNERPLTAEENLAEYNREKNEFYYDTHKNKMSYIPTDDAERQDENFKSNLKKWQLPPLDRRSPLKHVVPNGKGHTHTEANLSRLFVEDERDYSESTGGVKKVVLKKEKDPGEEKINKGGGVKKAVLKKGGDPANKN